MDKVKGGTARSGPPTISIARTTPYIIGMVAVFSIVFAAIYTGLVAAGFWQTALQIFTITGAIYTFIIARFEGPTQG